MTDMPLPGLPSFGPFPGPGPLPPPDLRTSVPQGGGEDIWLDTEQARAAVNELRRAAEDLALINIDLEAQRVIPVAKDLISTNFVNNCTAAVTDARSYFLAWQDQLAMAVDSLDKQVEAHELTEEQNRQNITRSW